MRCIQSDNGPHFVNAIIANLTTTLRIRHKLSTPYYPQRNGKVECVFGSLKSMLKRNVAAAAQAQCNELDDADASGIKVFGVGLELNAAILNAITAASVPAITVNEVDEIPVFGMDMTVNWAPLLQTVPWV